MQTLSEWIDEQKENRWLELSAVQLFGRPGSDFGPGAFHFQCKLEYWPNGDNTKRQSFIFEYSMGSGHAIRKFENSIGTLPPRPKLADCISALLCDASHGGYTFDEFLAESCAEITSAADYRRHKAAWRSCVETAKRLREMFPAEVFEMENDI